MYRKKRKLLRETFNLLSKTSLGYKIRFSERVLSPEANNSTRAYESSFTNEGFVYDNAVLLSYNNVRHYWISLGKNNSWKRKEDLEIRLLTLPNSHETLFHECYLPEGKEKVRKALVQRPSFAPPILELDSKGFFIIDGEKLHQRKGLTSDYLKLKILANIGKKIEKDLYLMNQNV